jgi:hypothetical protein
MMRLETNSVLVAMLVDARWIDEGPEKPTQSLKKSGQDPQYSHNDAREQREHRTKARKIHQKVHGFRVANFSCPYSASPPSLADDIRTQTKEDENEDPLKRIRHNENRRSLPLWLNHLRGRGRSGNDGDLPLY